jgi:hypothetical protein
LEPFGDLGAISDWSGKLAGALLRITGILHLAEHSNYHYPWEVEVSEEVMRNALQFAPYLIEHAKAAYGMMGANPALEGAKHILEWIRRRGARQFSKRDLYNETRSRFPQVKDLDPSLTLLVEHEYIRSEESYGEEPKRGRPSSPVFQVNPLLFQEEKPHAKNAEYAQFTTDGISAYCAISAESISGGETDFQEGEI